MTIKSKTFIIDIDGTLLVHWNTGAAEQWLLRDAKTLPDVTMVLSAIEAAGHHIVLMTARPEHLRDALRTELAALGVVYHQLVMGVTSGSRILVNDMKGDQPSAFAINVLRNSGIDKCLDWV